MQQCLGSISQEWQGLARSGTPEQEPGSVSLGISPKNCMNGHCYSWTRRPPWASLRAGPGCEKNIAEANMVSPVCSASGIGSINLLGFLIMDRNISRNQVCVSSSFLSKKTNHSSLHQHKRVWQEMPFQAPSKDDCRAHRNSLFALW